MIHTHTHVHTHTHTLAHTHTHIRTHTYTRRPTLLDLTSYGTKRRLGAWMLPREKELLSIIKVLWMGAFGWEQQVKRLSHVSLKAESRVEMARCHCLLHILQQITQCLCIVIHSTTLLKWALDPIAPEQTRALHSPSANKHH
jgi:hypothetical protein